MAQRTALGWVAALISTGDFSSQGTALGDAVNCP